MSDNIKAIIIDDERMARQELLRLLSKYPNFEIVAQSSNIDDGYNEIIKHNPDVIFLDIEMPGGTGLVLAEKLKGETPIVFCTAYDEFAVDAFALSALDYLVKPIDPTRLENTLNKIAKSQGSVVLDDDFKLMVKFSDHMKIIRLGDITRFQSIGNHAAIYTSKGKAYLHSSLNKIESRLDTNNYFRASRSDILRLNAIERLEQSINYGFVAYLHDGNQVEVSRRQASKLKSQLGFSEFMN